MSDFQFLKQYVFEEATHDVWSNKHVFFEVSESEIDDTEKKLNLKLPKELRDFYKEIGYGFLNCGVGNNVNRIISPIEIYDFYAGINDYEGDIRREYYKDTSSLIFFEVSSDTFITIDLEQVNSEGKCPVYYFKNKVSESIEEFVKRMELQNNFYKNK